MRYFIDSLAYYKLESLFKHLEIIDLYVLVSVVVALKYIFKGVNVSHLTVDSKFSGIEAF